MDELQDSHNDIQRKHLATQDALHSMELGKNEVIQVFAKLNTYFAGNKTFLIVWSWIKMQMVTNSLLCEAGEMCHTQIKHQTP